MINDNHFIILIITLHNFHTIIINRMMHSINSFKIIIITRAHHSQFNELEL